MADFCEYSDYNDQLLLPKLPAEEINMIYQFILMHKDKIVHSEVAILTKLIETYQLQRTPKTRADLKTFLLYLRRCVNPSPPARKPIRRRPLASASFQTPVRRPESRFSRPVDNPPTCYCHICHVKEGGRKAAEVSPSRSFSYKLKERFSFHSPGIFNSFKNALSPRNKTIHF